tara:strand:- start:158 stop:337 length:180 start_codon:yes stop_codon:yes gene_type:complete
MGILGFLVLVGGIILLTRSGYYKRLDKFKENNPTTWVVINILLAIIVFGWPFYLPYFLE